jgi:ATP-dependent helicase HrpB
LQARFPERFATREGVVLDARTGAVSARRRRYFGALLLEDAPLDAPPDPAAIAEALAQAAAARDFRDLEWTDAARQATARIGWMRRVEGDAWPEPSLTAAALAPWLGGMTRLSELRGVDMLALVLAPLSHAQRRALDEALPPRLPLPQGRSATVDYTLDVPRLEARAQHLFGLSRMPPLAGGRVPLHVALLSPAGRPIAITADLAGFWAGGWLDARKDMRGRYPKHDWPENPATAEAPPERRR